MDPNTRLFAALQDEKVGDALVPRHFEQDTLRVVDGLPAKMQMAVLGEAPRTPSHV